MKRNKWFYIIFFTVLIAGFYFLLTKLIPGYGKKHFPPISYVRPFSFINQDGQRFTEKDVAGKVYVAEFFYTTCPGICPRMNNNMKKVYEYFKNEKDFLILSHTCKPEEDSAAQLKRYAESLGVNTGKWIFLTGRKDSLYTMARISYTVDDPANNFRNEKDAFLHTQHWALVDRNGDVKKIYDGLQMDEVEDLIRDAEKLLDEK